MRARSKTELDTRRRLVTLSTCLPSEDELVFDHRRTSYLSWMKRYYFFILISVCFFSSLSNHYFSRDYPFITLYLFVDIRIRIIKLKRKKKKRQTTRDIFITFFLKSILYEIFFFFYRSRYSFSCFLILFSDTYMRRKSWLFAVY